MRRLLLLVVLVLTGCAGMETPSPPQFTSVAIASADPSDPWCASGIFIQEDLLLTASHVSSYARGRMDIGAGAQDCEVLRGGQVGSATGDPKLTFPVYVNDWAVVRLRGSGLHPIARIGQAVAVGDKVWLQGFPNGIQVTTSGTVQAHASFGSSVPIPDQLLLVRGDMGIGTLKGASGGGVLDAHGELVGILVGVMRTSTGREFWVVRQTRDLFP